MIEAASDICVETAVAFASKPLPRVKLPPLDPRDPNSKKIRDERLEAAFAEIERALIPDRNLESDVAKRVLNAPVGIAPK